MWAIICEALEIERRLSLVYYPEIDRAMERVYNTFSRDNWEDFLGIAQFAINNRVATFTGISLFFMTYGYNTLLLDYNISAAAGIGNRGVHTPAEMGNKIIRKLREAFDFA